MAPRSGRHSRYKDPYDDDSYIQSPPSAQDEPGYQYIGTDEPLSPRAASPPRRKYSPDHERARRNARTTSPPRHSRHAAARDYSPPRTGDRHRAPAYDNKKYHNPRQYYENFAENNPRLQRYGKQGFTFLGEAAAAYAAEQQAKEVEKKHNDGSKSRSLDRSDRRDRSERRHRRHASTSGSPSPPPRRRHSTRHGDRDREHGHDHDRQRSRRRQHSTSPSTLSRDPDSYLASKRSSDRDRGSDRDRNSDRNRDRHHDRGRDGDRDHDRGRRHRSHRRHSPGRSPSRRSKSKRRSSMPPPNNQAAERWQMAAKAALEAGGLTAFRLRNEPGGWTGGKAAKIATAALGAAALDAFMDQDPRQEKRGIKGMAENAVTSLIASQLVKRGKNIKV